MKLNFMRFRDEECKKKNEDEYRNQAIKSLMNENERLFVSPYEIVLIY